MKKTSNRAMIGTMTAMMTSTMMKEDNNNDEEDNNNDDLPQVLSDNARLVKL